MSGLGGILGGLLGNGGLLGGVMGGIMGGMKRGLELEQEGAKIMVWAVRTNNQAAVEGMAHVLATQVQEINALKDHTGQIPQEVLQSVLFGKFDPFEKSRIAEREAASKWKKDADTWWAAQGK